MNPTILSNVLAWSIQATLLTIIAAIGSRLLRIDAPAVRYGWWRAVLIVCVALPMVQPWQPSGSIPIPIVGAENPAVVLEVSPSTATAAPQAPVRPAPAAVDWSSVFVGALAIGALLRLGWLMLGLARLRRLRGAGYIASESGAPDALGALTDAGAEVRYVSTLRQPVTFGIRRPVVLLPQALAAMPAAIQRAVLVHELWHVRRRDWIWSLSEEVLRGAFWFNPAISYLVSRVQSAREEVVDELSVLATNAKRSYLEALLAFADEPAVHAAAPFARRRHLFHRMLLISKEDVMSPRRIVGSAALMAGMLVLTGWYGTLAFPLTTSTTGQPVGTIRPPGRFAAPGAAATTSMASLPAVPAFSGADATTSTQAQAQPRDPRPGVPRAASSREQELQTALRSDPTSVANWIELAKLQEQRGAMAETEATFTAALGATQSREVLVNMAQFFNRAGEFDKTMAALEQSAARDASDPAGHQLVAVYYWERAQKDSTLSPAQKSQYIQAGIAATDRALTHKADYVEALTYKNILLRMQANLEADTNRRDALLAEANALRERAMQLAKMRPPAAFVPGVGAPPPPPPPPPAPPEGFYEVDGVKGMRIGGEIKTPMKVRDVKPVYPQAAMDARISGMVIIEAVIDTEGAVRNARVLRSIAALDQAALDAVHGWRFAPTLRDGVAVPVIMTVTVNFTLQ